MKDTTKTTTTTDRELLEAIPLRHSVRRYKRVPLAEEHIRLLRKEIDRCNAESGLNIQLVTNERRAFTGLLAYGKFSGVENYIVMAGAKGETLDEKVGYYGERLVLAAQAAGLNTCWVGLSYRAVKGVYNIADGEKLACMIAVGYGETQGKAHKTKTVEQVSNASGATPDWFIRGVEAALLAPTAVNQQRFSFEYIAPEAGALPVVKAHRGVPVVGYTHMDLGIAKLHFELRAGRENFSWA
ncbi:MAG: nitroreductase family protein [Prevotella sp.]|nr:nitroreductase family protein [Prevotella sp.]